MSEAAPTDPPHAVGILGKHRIEALTDGIYAVAMTLLVIELKLPPAESIGSHAALVDALAGLIPKVVAWVISFFVLAIFWLSHHRLYQHLRYVDGTLLWRNLFQLALISLVPFSASLIGEHGTVVEAHYVYNANMMLLSLTSVWQLRYVYRHPAMQTLPMTRGRYHAALVRIGGLAACALTAIVLATLIDTMPYLPNYVYLAMWPIALASRRFANRDPQPSALPQNP